MMFKSFLMSYFAFAKLSMVCSAHQVIVSLYRIGDILTRFNPDKKPALVFCTTRKGTITAGNALRHNYILSGQTTLKEIFSQIIFDLLKTN